MREISIRKGPAFLAYCVIGELAGAREDTLYVGGRSLQAAQSPPVRGKGCCQKTLSTHWPLQPSGSLPVRGKP